MYDTSRCSLSNEIVMESHTSLTRHIQGVRQARALAATAAWLQSGRMMVWSMLNGACGTSCCMVSGERTPHISLLQLAYCPRIRGIKAATTQHLQSTVAISLCAAHIVTGLMLPHRQKRSSIAYFACIFVVGVSVRVTSSAEPLQVVLCTVGLRYSHDSLTWPA